MDAKEFNSLFISLGKERLNKLSFTQDGNKFYSVEGNKLTCFIKDSFKGSFNGIYLAIKFIDTTKDLKISPYLESYDHSIRMENLKQDMTAFSTPLKFKYDLQFYTREVGPTSGKPYDFTTYLDLIQWNEVQKDDLKGQKYIEQSLDIMLNEGLKFIELMTPENSYEILMKNKGLEDSVQKHYKQTYASLIDIKNQQGRHSWIKRLFN